ncbi:MAG: histidine kinase [Actinomycetia bacterium]|nr:histidine kinase [Actinomycetes bacterium]
MQDLIDFDPDELFFSTTDEKGVIQCANSVFVRLSQYSWDQLVGAPHSIIRHDEMPGAVYDLLWSTIQAGGPFCGYVMNRAQSGRPYVVFATITPLPGGGYLSVRSRPCLPDLLEAALRMYVRVRALERCSREQGASKANAAKIGLLLLTELLAGTPYRTYQDFMLAALPAEVRSRAAASGGLPERHGDGPLAEMLRGIRAVSDQLDAWLGQMDELAALAEELTQAARQLRSMTATAKATAARVVAARGETVAPTMLGVNVWASMLPEMDEAVQALLGDLRRLSASSATARFRIALARLHNDATGQFTVELIDSPSGEHTDAIGQLVGALREGLVATEEASQEHARLAAEVAASIDTVQGLLTVPMSLLDNWQHQVEARDDVSTELMASVASQIQAEQEGIQVLEELARRCRDSAVPLGGSVVEEQLSRISELLPAVLQESSVDQPAAAAS